RLLRRRERALVRLYLRRPTRDGLLVGRHGLRVSRAWACAAARGRTAALGRIRPAAVDGLLAAVGRERSARLLERPRVVREGRLCGRGGLLRLLDVGGR